MSGGSLQEVLGTKPDWWNNTAKCIAVTALILGLLILEEDHRLDICDFGPSIWMFPDEINQESIRTRAYVAPEMYNGKDHWSAVGVYAFGFIVYEILTRSLVFGAELSPMRILKKLCVDYYRPPIPIWVNEWVCELITKGWAQEPD
jgi:serine/threonine protein kinase